MKSGFGRLTPVLAILLAIVAIGYTASEAGSHAQAERLFLKGDYEGAFKLYFEPSSTETPGDVELYNAALLAGILGDSSTAKSLFSEAHILNQSDPNTLYQLALLDLSSQDTLGAIAHLNEAVALTGSHIEAMSVLSRLLAEQGNFTLAENWAHKALVGDPHSVPGRLAMSNYLELSGRWQDALKVLDEGIDLFPNSELLIEAYRISETKAYIIGSRKYLSLYRALFPSGRLTRVSSNDTTLSESATYSSDSIAFSPMNQSLPTGQRMVFKGSWGPFYLGDLIVEVGMPANVDGKLSIPITYTIQSNPNLPFIEVSDVYCAYLSPTLNRTLRYEMKVRETWWKYDRYCIMDYARGELVQRNVGSDHRIEVHRQELPVNLVDGTSLLFFARSLVIEHKSARAPTLIDYDYIWTEIHCEDVRESIIIKDTKHDCWVVDGNAGFSGIAGMTGHFKGWFSTDTLAMPLMASFKILIGSITLTLDRQEPYVEPGDTSNR